jgi:hypothetical protein
MAKARLCKHCGARNFTKNPRCSRCGEILSSSPTPTPTPIPYGHSSPFPSKPSQATGPYTGHNSSSPLVTATRNQAKNILKEILMLLHVLPVSVKGTVEDIEEVRVATKTKGGFWRGILSFFLIIYRPSLMLVASIHSGKRSQEYRLDKLIRIKQIDGKIVQARIKFDLSGASIGLGDEVTVNGNKGRGIIIVRSAFNHTLNADLYCDKISESRLGALILIFFLTIVIISLII